MVQDGFSILFSLFFIISRRNGAEGGGRPSEQSVGGGLLQAAHMRAAAVRGPSLSSRGKRRKYGPHGRKGVRSLTVGDVPFVVLVDPLEVSHRVSLGRLAAHVLSQRAPEGAPDTADAHGGFPASASDRHPPRAQPPSERRRRQPSIDATPSAPSHAPAAPAFGASLAPLLLVSPSRRWPRVDAGPVTPPRTSEERPGKSQRLENGKGEGAK